ncbi:MAG TPA: hypothetical protein VK966_12265 [Longimicrobiales bacterium]|nr:hypothetical protein [Longimicrobiales bacterium]
MLAAFVLTLAATPVLAQERMERSFPPPDLDLDQRSGSVRGWLMSPLGAATSSLVVPGAGQAMLGSWRWSMYMLLEAGLWWAWTDATGDFRDYRRAYRDLAWDAARLYDGVRRDGSWGYYEAMSQYDASGRYDADPAVGLQPEEDPATYNGTVWALARELYLPQGEDDPSTSEYALALSYYGERAAGPEFLWDWDGAPGALERFRSLIGSADDASRTATGAAGLILANHLVSAIDALLLARLRADGGPQLNSRFVPEGPGAWQIELRIPQGR